MFLFGLPRDTVTTELYSLLDQVRRWTERLAVLPAEQDLDPSVREDMFYLAFHLRNDLYLISDKARSMADHVIPSLQQQD
jgi:hypothetical protein